MLDMKKTLTKLMKAPIVVEQGTASDSFYRKYSDGTLEVWMSYYGDVTFSADRATRAFTLPVSFVGTPYMFATVNGDSSVYWSAVINCRFSATNSISVIVERKPTTTGDHIVGISLYAVGKWK